MTTQTKPNDVITGFNGLTKREYFAAMAMQAMITYTSKDYGYVNSDIINYACEYADILIDVLNGTKEM